MRSRSVVYAAGCALALVSCSDGTGSNITGTGACGPFSSQLIVEDKFRQESTTFVTGEPITFNLRITNHSDSPATLSYPDACSSIRLVVFDSRGRSVFDNVPDGIVCAALVRSSAYTPQEIKELRLPWNQTRSSDGGQLPADQYTVNARDRSLECRGDLDRTRDFAIR